MSRADAAQLWHARHAKSTKQRMPGWRILAAAVGRAPAQGTVKGKTSGDSLRKRVNNLKGHCVIGSKTDNTGQ